MCSGTVALDFYKSCNPVHQIQFITDKGICGGQKQILLTACHPGQLHTHGNTHIAGMGPQRRLHKGATQITITDPYIHLFYQMRNFMEFLETVVRHKALDEEVSVNLVTTEDEFKGEQQKENLEKIKESARSVGVTSLGNSTAPAQSMPAIS